MEIKSSTENGPRRPGEGLEV